ncbi:MAG TPA: winged helix-turn-helix domain-containing protein [Candidatus Nitrosocosmicus sp.]
MVRFSLKRFGYATNYIKYNYTHIYRILRKWGFKQKVPRKVHINTSSLDEEIFKRQNKYLWISKSSIKRKKDLQ